MSEVQEILQKAHQMEGFLTYEEAARFLGVTVSRIRQLSKEGGPLRRTEIDGKPFVVRSDVERYAVERKPRRRRVIATVIPAKKRRRRRKTVDVLVQRIIEDVAELQEVLKTHDEEVRQSIVEDILRRSKR